MLGLRHPFTRALYELDVQGNVIVHDGDRWGRFTPHGRWIEGDLREADPHLCGWVAGKQIANHRMVEGVTAPPKPMSTSPEAALPASDGTATTSTVTL